MLTHTTIVKVLPHLSVDVSVLVNVIKVKCPLQLFRKCPTQQDRQPQDKVLLAKERVRLKDRVRGSEKR